MKVAFSKIEPYESGGKTYWQPKVMFNEGSAKWHVGDLHSSSAEAAKQLAFIKSQNENM